MNLPCAKIVIDEAVISRARLGLRLLDEGKLSEKQILELIDIDQRYCDEFDKVVIGSKGDDQ